jgi:hypothetical protein
MKRLPWNTLLASAVVISINSPMEIGQSYQYFNSVGISRASQSLIIEGKPSLLSQSEGMKEADPSSSGVNKKSTKEQEALDRVLDQLWKFFLIICLLILGSVSLIDLVVFLINREGTTILPFNDLIKESTLSDENFKTEKISKENHNSGV